MLATQLYGKLLPTHQDIRPIIEDVRAKYQIPEITSDDNGLKVLLRHHLEINWQAVHDDILERLRDLPELLPERTRKGYLAFKKFQAKGLVDPELKKVSPEFRRSVGQLVDHFMALYQPTADQLDEFYVDIADHCLEFLLTGEARPIPQNWLASVRTIDHEGQKTVIAMANELADPDEMAELFKAEFYEAFGKDRPKLTKEDVKTADFLRMKWFNKPIDFILEEEEQKDPAAFAGRNSRRYPTAARRHHSRMKQRLYRLEKDLFQILK
jgi:hypothetical protein